VTELEATDWLVDGTEDAPVGRVLGWWIGALRRSLSSWWFLSSMMVLELWPGGGV